MRCAVPLAIPAAFLAAAAGMIALRAHAPADVAAGLAQPIAVVTNWQRFGAAQLGALAAGIALAAAAYLQMIPPGRAPAAGLRSPWAIAGVATLALLCAWCAPAIFSSDVYAYALYGELARLGADPYAHHALPSGNPLVDAAIVQWGNPPPACVYGPPFVWLARAAVTIFAPFGAGAQLAALRAGASLALPLAALLASAAYPGGRTRRLAASATIGLNPAAIWCAAEGHNDALTMAVALGGYALARRGWVGTGAAIAALAGSIKLPAIAACLGLGKASWRGAAGAAFGVLVALVVSAPLLRSLATGLPAGRYAPQASLQAAVDALLKLTVPAAPAPAVAWAVAGAAAAALAAAGAIRLHRRNAEGWAYLALGSWLLVPNPYPWYGIWLLAIAAAVPGTRGSAALIGLSLASLLRYVPDATDTPGPLAAILLGTLATLPYLALLRARPRLL